MGVELTLMPLNYPNSDLVSDMIKISQDYELFDAIKALPKKFIQKPIWSFNAVLPNGETGFGQLDEDPYGNRLTIVTSTDFLTLKHRPFISDFWRTKAAWAYIAEMPADWPIVLYWH